MPFWSKKDKKTADDNHSNGTDKPKEKINYKARFEHKQYLAQESPEPVYDISECGLKTVPAGVFSKCKVLRKEALLLHNNELTTLMGGGVFSDLSSVLQVLDLHGNMIEKLPEDIGALKELRVLYVQKNRLKKLPDSIGELTKLQSLDVSANNLKELPTSMARLVRLRTLDVTNNSKLSKFPKELANMRSCEKISLDPENFVFPDQNVCKQGTEAIMRFISKECDIEYIPPSEYQPPNDNSNGKVKNGIEDDPYDRIVRGSLKIIDKQKENKLKEMLAMQRHLEDTQAKEAELAANMQSNKQKLLTDIAMEEAKREEAVKKLQAMKEKEKETLVNSLYNAETATDALIIELMKSNLTRTDPQKVLEEMQRERKEMEQMFAIKAGEEGRLRQNDVLREMQRLMEEEMKREQVRRQYEEGRKGIINTALTNDLANDNAVNSVLMAKGKRQQELISNLLEDEKYQREAFTALFVKQDARHKEISQQVEQIQNELANLTMVEMTKKDLKMEFERDVMADKRETLTKMLMQLMDQKNDRAHELQNRLKELDDSRNAQTENYWLIQYQKLLDSKPKSLLEAEKNVDSALKDLLTNAGAEEFIPIFALRNIAIKQLAYMKDNDLLELGIHNTYLRQKILMSAEEYAKMSESASDKLSGAGGSDADANATPTAPEATPEVRRLADEAKPSAPPVETFQSNECVVCMENKCSIIFLPCGHVCCCWKCESQVAQCPLCRADVSQKVRVDF